MVDSHTIQIVVQLLDSMDQAQVALDRAYEKRDAENFKKIKEEMLELSKKIASLI